MKSTTASAAPLSGQTQVPRLSGRKTTLANPEDQSWIEALLSTPASIRVRM